MSAFGTSHRRALGVAFCASAYLLASGDAWALDAEWTLAQYLRDRWGSERGYTGGPVHALAQTPDGYLWIASERGLFRFDGLAFRSFAGDGGASGAAAAIQGLAVDRNGELWARLQGPALGRIAGGTFRVGPSPTGERGAVITAIHPARDGRLLIATLGLGILAVRGDEVSTAVPASAIPNSFVLSMAETSEALWLGTRDSGLVRVTTAGVTRVGRGLPDLKINTMLAVDDRDLLVGTDRGIARWTDEGAVVHPDWAVLQQTPVLAMTRDVDGGLWIAAGARGLLRIVRGRVERLDTGGEPVSLTTVFEDRERNIWVGSDRGIERLRDGVFLSYSSREGLPRGAAGAVHADDKGGVWFAHSAGGLFELDNGAPRKVPLKGLDGDVVYSIAGDADDLWLGRQRGGLLRLRRRGGRAMTDAFTVADGLPQNAVYAVCRARDGSVWAGTLSGGVAHLRDGRIRIYTTTDGLTSNTINAIVEDGGGVVWFATPTGVSALTPGGWRRYTRADGLPSSDAHTLATDSAGRLWVGTAAGVAFVERGRLRVPAAVPASLRRPVFGIAEDRLGWVWLTTAERVLRVRLEKLAGGIVSDADVSEYGIDDGLPAVEGVRRFKAIAAAPHGRVWLATIRGLSAADPVHAATAALPPVAGITSVFADGEALPIGTGVPPGRRRVAIGYAGVSLSRPERVRFRYRLDGFDQDWSEVVATREAVYTNLPPGGYRFRVLASGSDGTWTGAEGSLPFVVEPAVWQTRVFQWSLGIVAIAGTWGAYRLRLRQLSRQMAARFEERLAERTRIAQELHDTLLQGFVSASMQLHVAADTVPADSPARAALARVHRLMRQVIEDGRKAVQGLRAESAGVSLDEAFARLPVEIAPGSNVAFAVNVEGMRRPLHPLVYDGVYRIAREAVVNAYRHADAQRIEVALEYGANEFRLRVRDDGRGIDEPVRRAGRDGHWGLTGMRERAEDIGARLTLWSRAPVGTGVELAIPNVIAYRPMRSAARPASWRDLFRGRRDSGAGDS